MNPFYAYGSSYSHRFECLSFLGKVQVPLRILTILCSIIVFGCISAGGFSKGFCIYAFDNNACNYGIAIGVLAFLACLSFLVTDAKFDSISNLNTRKYIVVCDVAISGGLSFLWFVGFCYLTNKWWWITFEDLRSFEMWKWNNARAAIVFCFISIFNWTLLCFLAVRRYLSGARDLFFTGAEIERAQQRGDNTANMAGARSDFYAVPFSRPSVGGVSGADGGITPTGGNPPAGTVSYLPDKLQY